MTREEAIQRLKNLHSLYCNEPYYSEELATALTMAIEALQERPKGRWIEHNNDDAESPNDFLEGYDCSKCGGYKFIRSDFCPNCGADMRESEQE